MKKLFILSLLISISSFSYSQHYETALGVKGGYTGWGFGGLNLKHFLVPKTALEITLGGSGHQLRSDILFEYQNATGFYKGLEWYVGAGASVGTWRKGVYDFDKGLFLVGIVAVGLDFKFQLTPISLALETGPTHGLINARGFGWSGAFAIRYVLK